MNWTAWLEPAVRIQMRGPPPEAYGGFIEFAADEAHGLVRVYRLVWIG